jgi:dCMP deaminase
MISTTDRVYMEIAKQVAALSTDKSRKTSVVFVDVFKDSIIASGVNRIVPGVWDHPERYERPLKYAYTEHAERAAIYASCSRGTSLDGSTAYLPWFPCVDCARALAEVGVARVVVVEPDWNEERYDFRNSEAILRESQVEIEYFKETQ